MGRVKADGQGAVTKPWRSRIEIEEQRQESLAETREFGAVPSGTVRRPLPGTGQHRYQFDASGVLVLSPQPIEDR